MGEQLTGERPGAPFEGASLEFSSHLDRFGYALQVMTHPRGEGAPRIDFDTVEQVENWLKENSYILWTTGVDILTNADQTGSLRELLLAAPSPFVLVRKGIDDDGLFGITSGAFVTLGVLREMEGLMADETSVVRRLSAWPITRAFVYLDISDFSKLPTGVQLLVIQALVKLATQAERDISGRAEAKLCIGDGYIYVWEDAVAATRFAGYLAREIEGAVSEARAPEFHFRIGVHIGPVRCFWDQGRNGWNYVGDGINGGNRVLSAIGKETDDVVFVSGEVRSKLLTAAISPVIVPHLHNRGRKADKHGRYWRVYEYHHSAAY